MSNHSPIHLDNLPDDLESYFGDDRDDLPVFIHSELDDFPLSADAFRLYAHIARRAGQKGGGLCWSSYQSMGDVCFSVDYPISKVTRRKHAMDGIKELIEKRLIAVKKRTNEKSGNLTNIYVLTPRKAWLKAGSPGELGVKSADDLESNPRSPGELARSPGELARSPGEPKGTPSQGSPIEITPSLFNPEGEREKAASLQEPEREASDRTPTRTEPQNTSPAQPVITQDGAGSAAISLTVEKPRNPFDHDPLPPWRTGRGINDWNEAMLAAYIKDADRKYGGAHDRGQAVAYFAKRDRPSHPEHAAAIAHAQVLQALIDRQSAPQAYTVIEFSPPTPPPQYDEEELAARLAESAKVKEWLAQQPVRR